MTSNSLVPRHRWAVLAALAGVLVVGLSVVTAVVTAPKANAAVLTQVPNFGANPGNLAMFSYLPAGLPAGAPLVVALHGCTQSATGYYSDSGWPKYADTWQFAVVFPQQNTANNPQSCFDWYTPSADTRANGEAASIRQMITYAVNNYHADARRVYVTGLSAGGAMAADLLADYPDVFAGGAVDSGLPAQCATSLSAATNCQYSNQNKSPAQWGDLVRSADPGYTGPRPRVAIWQGSADYTVYPVNATELMQQWTNVWGIGQTPSSTRTLAGATTENIYDDHSGNPAVATFSIPGMGHGLAVHPGSATDGCGATAAYFLDYICSTYHTALFWGLDGSGSGTTTVTPSPTTTGPVPTPCFTASNYDHTTAGRAHALFGYAYANGSSQLLGLWSIGVITSLNETSSGYYTVVSGC